jgi:hypothetical protein
MESRTPIRFFVLTAFGLVFGMIQAQAQGTFADGSAAYRSGDYSRSVLIFRNVAARQPSSGAFQNLGNAEWQCHHAGAALQAWEQALWVNPLNKDARQNLAYARLTNQLEIPDLAWYEVVSSWLPASYWAWLTGGAFWIALAIAVLPGLPRRPASGWRQVIAALGLMLFLLSLPAHFGVYTRSRVGFILGKNVPLRLTPTADAQALTLLTDGDPARFVRSRGGYLLVHAGRNLGWIEKSRFGFVAHSPL